MKIVATVMLAASTALFTPFATPQATQPAFDAAAPGTQQMVPVSAAAPVIAEKEGYSDIQERSGSRWLPVSLEAGPEPSVAWVFALGFLGLVVMRRTRSAF